jgi:hypothetical protein
MTLMNDLKDWRCRIALLLTISGCTQAASWQSINLPNTPYANLQKLEQRIVQRGGYVRYTSIQVSITQISLEPCHGGTDRVPVVDVITKFRSCHAKIESNVVSHGPWVRFAEALHRYLTFLNIEV